jgi:hypothetical protein
VRINQDGRSFLNRRFALQALESLLQFPTFFLNPHRFNRDEKANELIFQGQVCVKSQGSTTLPA